MLRIRYGSGDDAEGIAEGANIRRQGRGVWQRVADNAFHLENDYGIPHAHEVLHARGVPVGQSNTAVACGAANCLRIIRAVNTDAGFIQPHPKNAD